MLTEKLKYQSQCLSLHNKFAKLAAIRHYFFLFGIILWLIFPLYGIILLLVYCQINISIQGNTNKSFIFKNFLPLIIFLLTITIFMSSFNSFGDTDTYIDVYRYANNEISLLDYMHKIWSETGMEPLTFLLPMYISLLTHGNESWFLLFQSLTFNTAFTVYAILFLPEVYPIVILFNLVSRGYYYQLFLMRQCYSFIFIIPFLYANNFYLQSTLIAVGMLSHVSAIMYALVPILNILIGKIRNHLFHFLKSRWFLLFAFIVTLFIAYNTWDIFKGNALILFTSLGVDKAERITGYSVSSSADISSSILYNIYTIGIDSIVLSVFIFNTDSTKIPSSFQDPFRKWRTLFFIIVMLYMIANFIGFNSRIYYMFGASSGFFYTITFYSGKLLNKSKQNIYVNIIVYLIVLKIILFIYDTIRYPGINNFLFFWDGTSLHKTIIEYLNFLYSIISS